VPTKKKSIQVVNAYGTMWARNKENMAAIPKSKSGGQGVYVLFDGSMPVYAGKGDLRSRINDAAASRKRGQMWDRFSWYAIADQKMTHDIEVLVLRLLPPFLRALNTQNGKFVDAVKWVQPDKVAVWITRKKPVAKKRTSR